MKRLILIAAALGVLAVFIPQDAQADTTAPAPDKGTTVGPNYVDQDGDGICDNRQAGGKGQRAGRGRGGNGPGDGTGNKGVGPKDGTGYGPGTGTNCDGTGPKGQGRARRSGRR